MARPAYEQILASSIWSSYIVVTELKWKHVTKVKGLFTLMSFFFFSLKPNIIFLRLQFFVYTHTLVKLWQRRNINLRKEKKKKLIILNTYSIRYFRTRFLFINECAPRSSSNMFFFFVFFFLFMCCIWILFYHLFSIALNNKMIR